MRIAVSTVVTRQAPLPLNCVSLEHRAESKAYCSKRICCLLELRSSSVLLQHLELSFCGKCRREESSDEELLQRHVLRGCEIMGIVAMSIVGHGRESRDPPFLRREASSN